MSQRPGSFVNEAGILATDSPADVVRKLDAAWEAATVECGNCHDGKSDMDHDCPKCSGSGVLPSIPVAPGVDLEQLIEVRNRLHVMSCRVGEEWEAEASELQNDVQKIIDRLQGYPCGRRDIRALFEEWAWPRSYSVVRYGEQYVESVTKKLWSAWQAAMQASGHA